MRGFLTAVVMAGAILATACGGDKCADLEDVCNKCSNNIEKQVCLGTLSDARKQSQASGVCEQLITAFPGCK